MRASVITENPILLRELRGRWRTLVAPAVLMLYCGAFAFVTYFAWEYLSWTDLTLTPQSAPGRRFLQSIVPWQTAFWVFMSPLVCCGSIASEREKAMFSGVVLTGMSPREIVLGKWLSALAYQVVFLLVPIPVFLTAMQMGGVAPEEIGFALLLQATAAMVGSMLGIFCSAWCTTGPRAFGMAVFLMLGAIISLFVLAESSGPSGVIVLHPMLTLMALFSGKPVVVTTSTILLSLITSLILTLGMFASATGAIGAVPLEKGSLIGNVPIYNDFAPPSPPPVPAASTSESPSHPTSPPGRLAVITASRSAVERFPIINAIALREVRVRFRWLEMPVAPNWKPARPLKLTQSLFWSCLTAWALSVPLHYWVAQDITGDRASSVEGFTKVNNGLSVTVFAGAALLCGIYAASCFTRERERGTLPEVLMTPQGSWSITFGYVEGVLWGVLGLFLPALVLLPTSFLGMSAPLVLGFAFAMAATMLLATAIGLFFSWIGEHTTVASAGTFAAMAGYPFLVSALRDLGESHEFVEAFGHFGLYKFWGAIFAWPDPWGQTAQLAAFGVAQLLVAGLILCFITAGIHFQRREGGSLRELVWPPREG